MNSYDDSHKVLLYISNLQRVMGLVTQPRSLWIYHYSHYTLVFHLCIHSLFRPDGTLIRSVECIALFCEEWRSRDIMPRGVLVAWRGGESLLFFVTRWFFSSNYSRPEMFRVIILLRCRLVEQVVSALYVACVLVWGQRFLHFIPINQKRRRKARKKPKTKNWAQ